MFFNLMKMIYFLSIVLTIMLSLSFNSWFTSWMMMEINLMMFIPFVCSKKYVSDVSPSIKYFLAQAFGSIILLIFIILKMMKSFPLLMESSDFIMSISMAVKSGTPPFHFWFPQLMEMCDWTQAAMILILQKMIPGFFMSYSINFVFFIIMIMSGIVGAMGGFNQNSLKKILAYSSMVHMAWLMMSMTVTQKLMINYFMFYSLINLVLLNFMKTISNSFVSGMAASQGMSMKECILFMTNLFSLAGLPPFLGFFIKLMVINSSYNTMILFVLVMFSIISLCYYMRLSFPLLMEMNLKLKETNKLNYSKNNLLVISILMNIMCPMMMVYLT